MVGQPYAQMVIRLSVKHYLK